MGLLSGLFQAVTDVEADCDVLKRRSYGVIEVRQQMLAAIHLRPYPKLVSVAEIQWSNVWKTRANSAVQSDRVMLYYNQPLFHPNFLALKYFVSDYKSTLASIAVSLAVLDYIAKIKQADAIVTEITNPRIKDRHLSHFGWEQHLLTSRKRHWIKRFYGVYPDKFLFQQPVRSQILPMQGATPVFPRIQTAGHSSQPQETL